MNIQTLLLNSLAPRWLAGASIDDGVVVGGSTDGDGGRGASSAAVVVWGHASWVADWRWRHKGSNPSVDG